MMVCCIQVPGGFIEDSCVLRGVMINKDVTHPRMKRMIKNPRIVLLDCSLEYKKGESQVSHPPHTHTQTDRGSYTCLRMCVTCVNVCLWLRPLQTDIEISKEEDFARILQMEEEYIQQICEDIIRLKPDLLFTEKGISGTCQLQLSWESGVWSWCRAPRWWTNMKGKSSEVNAWNKITA